MRPDMGIRKSDSGSKLIYKYTIPGLTLMKWATKRNSGAITASSGICFLLYAVVGLLTLPTIS